MRPTTRRFLFLLLSLAVLFLGLLTWTVESSRDRGRAPSGQASAEEADDLARPTADLAGSGAEVAGPVQTSDPGAAIPSKRVARQAPDAEV